LLDEMATQMARDAVGTADPGELSWQQQLRNLGTGMRSMLRSRRDGARLFGGTAMTDTAPVVAGEPLLQSLTEAGSDLRSAVAATRAVTCFVIGFVLEEEGAVSPTGARDPRFDPDARRERIDAQRFPLTAGSSEYVFGNFEQSFNDGLELIITGVAARLGAPANN